ncbi:MAG: type II toxin-antitoxin system RelE/ParE family toxin [Burkholderiales bacterium]|jgi:plasmid stabilization system protein ParE|nr:type II toxin-antitoxin system RelE/ParE family toxin [Burkholderiales bacterium]
MTLAFSHEARDDLVRLRSFIAAQDPAVAERVAASLVRGIERVVRHPQIGKRVSIGPGESAPDEIRDWLVGPCVVRHLIAADRIVVLRVWHGREQRE